MTLFLRNILICFLFLSGILVYSQCITTNITGDLIVSTNQSLEGTYNITGLFKVNAGIKVTVTPYSSNSCGELVINAQTIEIEGTIDADGAGNTGGNGGSSQSGGVNTTYLSNCADKDNCYTVQAPRPTGSFSARTTRFCWGWTF